MEFNKVAHCIIIMYNNFIIIFILMHAPLAAILVVTKLTMNRTCTCVLNYTHHKTDTCLDMPLTGLFPSHLHHHYHHH